jgi:hypothetical protein
MNEERYKMHIFDEDNHTRCRIRPESIMHVLRDCNEARDFWSPLIKPNHWQNSLKRQ